MPDFSKTSFSPVTIAKNAVIMVVFFLIAFWSTKATVPVDDPSIQSMVAAATALAMALTAWIAWHMLRAVYLDEKEHRQKKNSG